jgi:hypothetical protein
VKFVPGNYYRLLTPPGTHFFFGAEDVENWGGVCVPLRNGEIVVCTSIGRRRRGRFAKLLHQRDGRRVVLYLRVSKNHIPSGTWEPLNPLEVLALADSLPTV